MLDAQELGKRIRAAMDYRDPPLASVELAAKCGVTKQAVYEWRTTGRMGKTHLITVAQETGMPLEFFLEAKRGQSDATRAIWRRLGKALARAAIVLIFAASQYLLPNKALAATSEFNNNQFAPSFFAKRLKEIHIARLSLRRVLAKLVRLLTAQSHELDWGPVPA